MSSLSYPTPVYAHAGRERFEDVYEPAEDSFLFIDALERDAEKLQGLSVCPVEHSSLHQGPLLCSPGFKPSMLKLLGIMDHVTGKNVDNQSPSVCLEVGSGSGVVSAFLASVVGSSALYLCTDVNSLAASCTATTATCNDVALQPVITDLVQCLLPRLCGKVDVLLFNPPYVVTPSEEVGGSGIEAAWAGGRRGREVIDRFLPMVTQLLSNQGLFYIVTIAENCPEEIIRLLGEGGLTGGACLSRRAHNERLSVLRFHRTPLSRALAS